MSNLLPIPSIASARAAARNRIIAAAAALLLIAVIPPLCIAAVAYVALPSDAGAVAPAARQEATDLAALDQSQRLMSQLTPMLVPERAPHNAVISVLSLAPAGVAVTGISYARDGTRLGEGTLTLSGVATASTIASYRDALLESKQFASVGVPVNALVGFDARPFTITLTGTF
jgi:hypothetical protein